MALPRNVKTRKRTIGFIDYREGETLSLALPTGGMLLETYVRVSYTITNAATGPVTYKYANSRGILRRVDMEIGGTDQVVSLNADALKVQSHYDFGRSAPGAKPPSSAANAVTDLDIYFPLIHWLPNSQTPLMTALDLRGVQSANIRVEWGGIEDIYVTPNGATISDVKCEIIGVFFENMPADMPSPFVRELGYSKHQVNSTTDQYRIEYEKRTGKLFRHIGLITLRDGVRAVPDDGNEIFSKDLRVFSGGEIFLDGPAEFYGLREDLIRDVDPLAGYYPIAFDNYGDPGQMLDSNMLQSSLIVEAAVNGPSGDVPEILSVTEFLRPLRLR